MVAALLVAGCGDGMSAEEKARRDAADVAAVEAAQERHPPIVPIVPEPITPDDKERHRLSDAGCSFVPTGSPDAHPVLLTAQQKAVLKLEGKLVVLAADSASAELPHGTRTEYAGRTHALRLDRQTDRDSSARSGVWPAFLTISDRFERPVFKANGTLNCGPNAIRDDASG